MNPSEKTRGAALTVLVADDDQTLRMLMRELLEGHLGAEVAEVASGTEAWNKLDAGLTPDLCIFDLRMPGIAGLSLLTRLRRDPRFKDLPVMICSTINSRSTIVEAAGLHVDAFLLKPFKADEFLERVRALCRKPRTDLPPPLEPAEEVLKRLGVETTVYLRLLAVFGDEVQSFLRSCSTSLAANPDEFLLRVTAIKGAASSLGAIRLTEMFAGLEQSKSFRSPEHLPILKAIEQERLRIVAAGAKLQQKAGQP